MSLSSEFIKDDWRFNEITKAIEKREVEIGGVKVRIRVLSFHPSLQSGEFKDEVTLRLDLRPKDNTSELLIVQKNSFEARLSELGLTYPFKLDGDIEKHVDALVKAIKEDAPFALARSPAPQVVFIDPVSRNTKIFAAVAALLFAIILAALWRTLTETFHWERFAETARVLISIIAGALVYGFLTARRGVK